MRHRTLLALLLLLALAAPASGQLYIRAGQLSESWSCSLAALDDTLTQCKALVAGVRHYITDISVQTTTTTAGTYAIRTGTGTNCAGSTTNLFPSVTATFAAPISTQPMANLLFLTPLSPTAGHAICVIGTATNTINIHINGFDGP